MVRPVIAKSSSSFVEEEVVQALVCLNSRRDGPKEKSSDSSSRQEKRARKKAISTSSPAIDTTATEPATRKPAVKTHCESKLRGGDTDEQHKKDLANRPFPEKLMDLLLWCDAKASKDAESNEKKTPAIQWLPDGRSFEILSIQRFTLEVLPKFFEQTEYSSFTRKLYWWGFKKKSRNEDGGHDTFYHELFLRDDPKLCTNIRGRRSSGQQQNQHTLSHVKYEALKRCDASSPRSSPTVSNTVTRRKRDAPVSGPYLPLSKRIRPTEVERVSSCTPRHRDLEASRSKSSLLITPPNTPPYPVVSALATSGCDGDNLSSKAGDSSLRALRCQATPRTARHPYGVESSAVLANARRVSNDFGEMLSPYAAEKRMHNFPRPLLSSPNSELSTTLREAVLKRRHELLIEQHRHEQLQQEKVLAAAAIMEAHTRRARDLQRQQEEAERQAVAAAALILGSSGANAGASHLSSFQPTSPDTLAVAQEELLLRKRLSLLSSSEGHHAISVPARSAQHSRNIAQDAVPRRSLFLR